MNLQYEVSRGDTEIKSTPFGEMAITPIRISTRSGYTFDGSIIRQKSSVGVDLLDFSGLHTCAFWKWYSGDDNLTGLVNATILGRAVTEMETYAIAKGWPKEKP